MSILSKFPIPLWLKVTIAFFRSIPLWAYAGAGLLVLFGIFRHHYIAVGVEREHGKTVKEHAALVALQGQFKAYRQQAEDAAKKATSAAKAAEKAQANSFAAAAVQLKKDQANAIAKKDRVIRDLRSGALQLRPEWTCPATASAGHLPEAAGSTGIRDATAELRAAGAGSIVRIAADADAQVTALQSIVLACQGVSP
jgi:hypothetical protein